MGNGQQLLNLHFLNQPMGRENLDSTIKTMNDVSYNYFLQNDVIGSMAVNGKLMDSYKHKSVKEMKADLKTLKSQKADTVEITFAANVLCKKLQRTDTTCVGNGNSNQTVNHDHWIKASFWGYIKTFLKKSTHF